MGVEEDKIIQEEAIAMELAYKSLVDFRRIYLPSPADCEAAPFHHEWSEILLHGKQHFAQEAFRESGKGLALDTKVLTTKGWKTMGDIKVGDYV